MSGMTMMVGLSMAEIVSSLPSSGGELTDAGVCFGAQLHAVTFACLACIDESNVVCCHSCRGTIFLVRPAGRRGALCVLFASDSSRFVVVCCLMLVLVACAHGC